MFPTLRHLFSFHLTRQLLNHYLHFDDCTSPSQNIGHFAMDLESNNSSPKSLEKHSDLDLAWNDLTYVAPKRQLPILDDLHGSARSGELLAGELRDLSHPLSRRRSLRFASWYHSDGPFWRGQVYVSGRGDGSECCYGRGKSLPR